MSIACLSPLEIDLLCDFLHSTRQYMGFTCAKCLPGGLMKQQIRCEGHSETCQIHLLNCMNRLCTHEHVWCFLFINFAVMNSILAECSWIQVEWSVWIRWFPLNFRVSFANILNIWEKLYYSSLAPILDSLYPIETAYVSQAIRFIHVTMLQTDFCPSTCEMEVYGDMWMLSEENTLWGQKGPTGMRHLSPDNLLKVCFLELMIGLVFLMISLE